MAVPTSGYLQQVDGDGVDHTKARPHPSQVLHEIQAACPGWSARHHAVTGTYSARRGWLEVHGRDADEVARRVRGVTFAR